MCGHDDFKREDEKCGVCPDETTGNKSDLSAGLDGLWTNDSWTIQWLNKDEILITGPYDQKCKMCGGDFESLLSGLCGARRTD